MLAWFDSKDVDALADSMARDLVHRIPPASVDAEGKKKAAKRQKAHDIVLRQAHDFVRHHKLNLYTKARLANRFKWALLEAGYSKSFVDGMTYELASIVAAAQAGGGTQSSDL